jgi:hypothetical protein
MTEEFCDKLHLRKDNIAKLNLINSIIEEYTNENLVLTLRQLFYQLVTREIIPNTGKEYKKLSPLLTKGRMAGIVDWEAIEDRTRVPYLPYWLRDIADALDDTAKQYRLDRQKGQKNYLELWIEKDALSGVLKSITSYYHINLMVNRGFSSTTAMHDAYERISEQENLGKEAIILYLGDHDPSGLFMVQDIKNRLNEFGVDPEIKAIGLTMEQVKKYNPPPNTAKEKDPRAKEYIREFGHVSWEVDALNPKILNVLVKKNIEARMDTELFKQQLTQEEQDKEKLREIADEFGQDQNQDEV